MRAKMSDFIQPIQSSYKTSHNMHKKTFFFVTIHLNKSKLHAIK